MKSKQIERRESFASPEDPVRLARHCQALWQDRDLLSAFVRDMAGNVKVFRKLAETAAADSATEANPLGPVVEDIARSARELESAVRRLMLAADRLSARQVRRPLDS